MASAVYNKGKQVSFDWATDTIKAFLVSASYTFNADHDFVDDADTNELSGTGYVRKTLASKTLTVDDTADEVRWDAADITWTGADFGTVNAMVIYKEVVDDTDSELIAYVELSSPAVTNGGDFTFQFGADGCFKAT